MAAGMAQLQIVGVKPLQNAIAEAILKVISVKNAQSAQALVIQAMH